MTDKQKKILIALGGFVVVLIVLFIIGARDPKTENKTVELTVWGTEDPVRVWNALSDAYQVKNKNARIKYTQYPEETYEDTLVDALAAGTGPDVFMFRSSWLLKHYRKAAPAPSDIMTATNVGQLFPQVVQEDFVLEYKDGDRNVSEVYALPLYIDTLALLYNKDMFDAKHIAVYPATWQDFRATTLKLRTISQGKVTQSGAAMGGTSASVSHAPEILPLLMRQFGAEMVDLGKREALFGSGAEARDALDFYMQFSNPSGTYYTWNDWFDPSLDSFAAKQVGMVFGYARDIVKIKEKNAYINLGIHQMPQSAEGGETVNTADYWGLAVSNDSANYRDAWDFIVYITTNTETMRAYTVSTSKPPALRSLINDYLAHETLGVFAEQALTARSWSQVDPDKTNEIFDTMIARVLDKSLTTDKAVKQAAEAVTADLQAWK